MKKISDLGVHTTRVDNCSIAYGVNTKIKSAGKCSNPDILTQEEKDRDPINPIDKCVFCKEDNCYYDGDCNRRVT